MNDPLPDRPRKGRGAISNRSGRFESRQAVTIDDGWGDAPAEHVVRTTVSVDAAKTIICRNDSPDVPFDQSVNPYRGCEHGCVYCFARPGHAYLGLSPGLDFETRLFMKPNAAELLRRELGAPGYRCRVLAVGTNTDPYQPIERRYRVMRQLLEVLAEAGHPVSITTKSSQIECDIDLLAAMAADQLVQVSVSITTLDHALARAMEPRATAPRRRVETIRRLAEAGIPVAVSVAPVIPALNDHELEGIVAAAAEAGASSAAYILLRLPREVRALFKEWLATHYPDRAAHVMSLIRQSRQGAENDAQFGRRMRGTGAIADAIAHRFRLAVKRHGLDRPARPLDTSKFRRPAGEQLSLL